MGQEIGLDARAVVSHLDQRMLLSHAQRELDLAAFLRVLGRVIEQIGNHLRESREVSLQPDRLAG